MSTIDTFAQRVPQLFHASGNILVLLRLHFPDYTWKASGKTDAWTRNIRENVRLGAEQVPHILILTRTPIRGVSATHAGPRFILDPFPPEGSDSVEIISTST